MYRQIRDINNNIRNDAIIRLSDAAFIPFDEENKDYQEYLTWRGQGNEPQEA
jgi:hypothetical protein